MHYIKVDEDKNCLNIVPIVSPQLHEAYCRTSGCIPFTTDKHLEVGFNSQ